MSQTYRIYTIVGLSSDDEILDSIEMDLDATLDEVASEWFSMVPQFYRVEIHCDVRIV